MTGKEVLILAPIVASVILWAAFIYRGWKELQ